VPGILRRKGRAARLISSVGMGAEKKQFRTFKGCSKDLVVQVRGGPLSKIGSKKNLVGL